jgi:ankyrin repeat protein
VSRDAMFDAIDAGDEARLGELLAAEPGLAGERDDDGVSAALHARYRDNHDAVAQLLATDPDLDIFDAAGLGRPDRLAELLGRDRAGATAFSSDGFTSLHLAAFFGQVEVARLLIAHSAPPNVVSRNALQVMPLHSAAAGSHVGVARLLVAAGADVNAVQPHGYRPLHAAAQNGNAELTELLLAAGADPAARTDDGQTSADLAAAAGHEEIAERLRRTG